MRHVIVAPFANNDLRDWPLGHYARMIGILVARGDILVEVVGTARQQPRAECLIQAGGRVVNACGRHDWAQLASQCRDADCVVGNNSGVAHLAGRLGVAVVCVFGAAHDRAEWGPIGPRVTIVSRQMTCSPCHLPRAADCRAGLACLRDIQPHVVANVVIEALARPAAMQPQPFAGALADPVL
jgi:ADP-heptose:LPS heptosyltransferase